MSRTKTWAIPIVILCTIFTSVGALLVKIGVDKFQDFTIKGMMPAYPVIIGIALYFLGFLSLTIALKHGELSTVFPFISLSFIWVAIFSYIFLQEKITIIEILGVTVIVVGVAMIGISEKFKRSRVRLKA